MDRYIKETLILIFFLIISCVFSILFFNLPDYDFYSYHYYNGWAFLNNRINIDFMPCFFRSYFNPILDSLMYLSIEKLNDFPMIFVMFSGLKYGIFMFLAYKIFDFAFNVNGKKDIISILFCLVIVAFSPILLYCINFDKTDIQTAIFILAGVYIYLKNIFTQKSNYNVYEVFFASLLIGLAVGLKYTNITFAASILLTTICMYKKINNLWKVLLILIFGLFCGFMVTNAYWMGLVYYKFQNPMFPYFNNIFMSSKADVNSVLVSDYYHLLPHTISDFIFYPLKNTLVDTFISLEKKYFDLKTVLGFISILLSFKLLNTKNLEEKNFEDININIFYFSLFFVIFTYYINLILFASYRYIISLFVFVSIIICYFAKIICKKNYYNYFLSVILVLFFATNQLVLCYIWLNPKKIIDIPKINVENDATIICGNFTSCFFAPTQNKNIKYVGYSLQQDIAKDSYWNNINLYKNQYYTNKYLENTVKEIIKNEKHIYFAYSKVGLGQNLEDLKLYEKSINKYLDKKIKLETCPKIDMRIFDEIDTNEIFICKIKD